MNRIISSFLILIMVLSFCACAIDRPSATEPTQTTPDTGISCVHELEVIQTAQSSCADPGFILSVCKLCGEKFSEDLPALGHSFTNASCIAAPLCTVCGFTSGSALGHTYIDGICTHCGDKFPQDVPSDCLHNYVLTRQTAPTCTDAGNMDYQCIICDHTYTLSIAATGHRFSDASCIAAKTCIVCKQIEGSALGHSYHNGQCTRCGEEDPNVLNEVIYTVTVRAGKDFVPGIIVSVYTIGDVPAATGKTNSDGIATMTLLPAASYRIVLSNIPSDFVAKESYTFSSTRVNINLSIVSVITPTDHSKANYMVGSTMGDFTLSDTDDNTYTLSRLLKEKDLVILNFWFVNCGPCKAEFPYFEGVNSKYENVQLLTLNHLDTEKDIVALRQQMGVSFPMIAENIGFQQGFGLYAYPTTVFIAPSGQILKIQIGEFKSQAELEALIDSLIK